MIVWSRTIVMGALLQGRELSMSMRDLGRAHRADDQNADQRKDLQPYRSALSQSELE